MNDRAASDFGPRLKRAREARGVSLREIATATKISVGALEALERNDISRLPGGIFSRGIVRSYSLEVGLDPEETVRDFIDQFPTDAVTAGSPHVPTEDHAAIESDRHSAETVLALAAISVPLGIAILYFSLSSAPWPGQSIAVEPERQAPAAPEQVTSRPSLPAALPEVTPAEGPAAAVVPATEAPIVLTVTSRAGAWVELWVDDVRVLSRMLEPGEQTTVRAARVVVLAAGDAGAVSFTLNNRPGIALGAPGAARTIRITRETLATFIAP